MPAATGSIPEFRFGHVVVEPRARRVLIGNEPARVGARAFDVLQALIEHRERVVGKDELLARVWPGMVVEENNLEVHISSLRKVLGAQVIATDASSAASRVRKDVFMENSCEAMHNFLP